MAHAVVDEAIRNVVAVGADPDKVALLDNFSWGDPRRPSTLGELVAAVRGCCDASMAHQAPFVSGKDSLNNEYLGADGARHSVPPTLVITAIAHVPDANAVVTPDLKQRRQCASFRSARTACEFGGSHFAKVHAPATGRAHGTCARRRQHPPAIDGCIVRSAVVVCRPVTTSARVGWPSPLPRWRSPAGSACRSTRFQVPILSRHCSASRRAASCARLRADDVAWLAEQLAEPVTVLGTVTDEPTSRLPGATPIPLDALISAFGAQPMSRPTALVLAAAGTNRDHDVAFALDLAGAEARDHAAVGADRASGAARRGHRCS